MDYKKKSLSLDCVNMNILFNLMTPEIKTKILEAFKTDLNLKLTYESLPSDKEIEEKIKSESQFLIDIDKNYLTPYNFSKLVFLKNPQEFYIQDHYLRKLINDYDIEIPSEIYNQSKFDFEVLYQDTRNNSNAKISRQIEQLNEKISFMLNEKDYLINLKDEIDGSIIVSVDFEKILAQSTSRGTEIMINKNGLNTNKNFMEALNIMKLTNKKIEIPTEFAYYIEDKISKKRHMEHVVFSDVLKTRYRENIPTFMTFTKNISNIDNYLKEFAEKLKLLNKPIIFVGLGISNDLSLLKPHLNDLNIEYKVKDLKDIANIFGNVELSNDNLLNMYLKTSDGSFVKYNQVHNPLNDCVIGVETFHGFIYGKQTQPTLNVNRLGIEYIEYFNDFKKSSDLIDNREFFTKIHIDSFAKDVKSSIITYTKSNNAPIDIHFIDSIISYGVYKNFYKQNGEKVVSLKDSFNFLNDVIEQLEFNFKIDEKDISGIKDVLKYKFKDKSIYYPKHIE